MTDVWITLRVKLKTLAAARAALQILAVQLHDEARVEPDKRRRDHLRLEADHYVEQEREMQMAEARARNKQVESDEGSN